MAEKKMIIDIPNSYLTVLPDEPQEWVDHPVKHVVDELLVGRGQ